MGIATRYYPDHLILVSSVCFILLTSILALSTRVISSSVANMINWLLPRCYVETLGKVTSMCLVISESNRYATNRLFWGFIFNALCAANDLRMRRMCHIISA